MQLLNIDVKMSSADHPESDGQSDERTNRTVIEMLRIYVNERNNNWSDHIPLIEISINDYKQSSTGYSPFMLNYGFNPNFGTIFNKSLSTSSVRAVKNFFIPFINALRQLNVIWKMLSKNSSKMQISTSFSFIQCW